MVAATLHTGETGFQVWPFSSGFQHHLCELSRKKCVLRNIRGRLPGLPSLGPILMGFAWPFLETSLFSSAQHRYQGVIMQITLDLQHPGMGGLHTGVKGLRAC